MKKEFHVGILQLPFPYVGQSGLIPDKRPFATTDNLGTVTTAGYLNSINLEAFPLANNSIIEMLYSYNLQTNSGTYGLFSVSISNGVITLAQLAAGLLPANIIQTSAAAHTQNIAGNLTLNSNPVVAANVVTASAAALATAGKVNVFVAPTATAQIAILDIKVMKSTGLSGGGGDRLLSLADGTLVFNNTGITAALLGTPIFTLWGGTDNPIASSSEATISTAGANVYLQYIGGTTDYTTGSVIVAVTYAQVAA